MIIGGVSVSLLVGLVIGFLTNVNGGNLDLMVMYYIKFLFYTAMVLSFIAGLALVGAMFTDNEHSAYEMAGSGIAALIYIWVAYFISYGVARFLQAYASGWNLDFSELINAVLFGAIFSAVATGLSTLLYLVTTLLIVSWARKILKSLGR